MVVKPDNRTTVEDSVIKLDYSELKDTIFLRCKLVYEGGRPPTMIGCDFVECEFIFEGRAQNTLKFLSAIAHGGDGGAEMVVKHMLGIQGWSPKNG